MDFANYVNWPTNWPSSAYALTLNYDSDGDCYVLSDLTTVNPNCSNSIDYSQIFTNPNKSSGLTAQKKEFLLAHELGHTMCLAHPDSSTVSIMHNGSFPTWSNFERPQAHDVNDLNTYYPN